MTEYWKSQPKKFCEACKCWLTDNKASIDFHERGAKHKANVQQRLRDARQSGKETKKDTSSYEKDILKIEAAALSAYAKDLSTNPSLASKYGSSAESILQAKREELKIQAQANAEEEAKLRAKSAAMGAKPPPKPSTSTATENPHLAHKFAVGFEKAMKKIVEVQEKQAKSEAAKKWQEAQSDDGYTFFWHIESGETRWDAPPEGYVSIAEQLEAEGLSTEGEEIPALRTKPLLPSLDHTPVIGGWTKVEQEIPEQQIDLQIPDKPKGNERADEIFNQVLEEEYAIEFKEKVVKSSVPVDGNAAPVAFKKRAIGGAAGRSVKKREE